MLDIRWIRQDPDRVRERLASRRGGDEQQVEEILRLDGRRREVITRAEELKAQRNRVSKEIGALIGKNEHEAAEAKKKETRSIGEEIDSLDRQATETEQARDAILLRLPNLPAESVPDGEDETWNKVVRSAGTPRLFDFPLKTHTELCTELGLVDFPRGTKLAGSGFAVFTHWGARLERALIQFMLDLHSREHGYTEVNPPLLVNRDVMTGVGQLPKFIDQVYMVQEGEDSETLGKWFLIPTAEAPVANLHRDETLHAEDLPRYYCAATPCFRAEAGAAGVGTRGLIRVHQFEKVELIKLVTPEKSYEELEKLVGEAERVLELLGLHYQVIELCSGDLGFASAKTYDIEVWAPGQQQYLEVSSCSNCEDFQARRMNLKYKSPNQGSQYPHVLNGSGTALARLFVALVETYQRADGGLDIPEPLQAYLKTDRLPA